jgi:hypothetical protein
MLTETTSGEKTFLYSFSGKSVSDFDFGVSEAFEST